MRVGVNFLVAVLAAGCCSAGAAGAAGIEVIDDNGRAISLAQPARRVITLTPHVTEMIYAAGAGQRIVATVTASDFPPEARALARIGDGLQPDPEKVAAYKPDLVVGWLPSQADALEVLDVPVFISAPRLLDDIPDSIETFGVLLGTPDVARARADDLRRKLEALAPGAAPPQSKPVRVFVQSGSEPDYTLGADHILTDVIALCGGVNVFADSPMAAPRVSPEGVLAAAPEIVIVGRPGASAGSPDPAALEYWKSLGLPAALAGRVYMFDADTIYRPGPRLIDAAAHVCRVIRQARKP